MTNAVTDLPGPVRRQINAKRRRRVTNAVADLAGEFQEAAAIGESAGIVPTIPVYLADTTRRNNNS